MFACPDVNILHRCANDLFYVFGALLHICIVRGLRLQNKYVMCEKVGLQFLNPRLTEVYPITRLTERGGGYLEPFLLSPKQMVRFSKFKKRLIAPPKL